MGTLVNRRRITMTTLTDMLQPGRAALTAALAIAGTAVSADLPYRGEGHLMLTPDELEWSDIASMAPPAQIAVIEGNLSAEEPFTFRLLLPDGYEVPPHVHPEYERVTVISGTFHFAHGQEFDRDATMALPQGSVAIMAPGEPMFGYAGGETVIQLHGTGPWGIDYIREEDDPRP
jgi:quercetin dioxygenase-like cupin family protein